MRYSTNDEEYIQKREDLRDKMSFVEYKPYDKVLVRCEGSGEFYGTWIAAFFSHSYGHRGDIYYVTSSGHEYMECIPFEPNAHLCGTESDDIVCESVYDNRR